MTVQPEQTRPGCLPIFCVCWSLIGVFAILNGEGLTPFFFTGYLVALSLWSVWKVAVLLYRGITLRPKVVYVTPKQPGTKPVVATAAPTPEDDNRELERRYLENVARIEKSRLGEEAKQELLEDELRVYEERLRQLLR